MRTSKLTRHRAIGTTPLILTVVAGMLLGFPTALAQSPKAADAKKPDSKAADPKAGAPAAADSPRLAAAPLRPALQAPAWTLDDYATRSLQRLAAIDLRLTGGPDQRDYKLATFLLDQAAKMKPDDADLVRRKIECEWNAGDEERAVESTQKLLKLDPSDTVAQLRLISARIGQFQTAEERLAAYERFTGPEGKGLDPAIRSRLALDAALLYRERNNDDKFTEKLKLATALDPTNKEAALVAYTYYADSVDDAVGRLELMSNMLYADPLDPQIYLNMVDELASGGAFNGASRLFGIAEKIIKAAGSDLQGDMDLHRLALVWQVAGPKSVRDELERSLNAERHNARQVAEHQMVMKVPGEDVIDPNDVRLPRTAEVVRAFAAFSEGNAEAVDTSLTDLALTTNRMMKEAPDDSKRPRGVTKEDAQQISRDSFVDLQIYRGLMGVQVDKIETDFSKLEPPLSATDLRPAILAAIVKGAKGDHAGAVADLTPFAIDKSSSELPTVEQLNAQLAKGIFYEKMGRKPEAGAAYREIIKLSPLTVQGAAAASLFERVAGKHEPVFANTAALEKVAASIPRWIEDIVSQPRNFVGVSAEPLSTTQDPLSPMLVKLSIRNLGALPMGLGANRPMNSRFLFTPNIDMKAAEARRMSKPEVVDLDRRLRLMPGETLEAVVWADPGLTGWFCEDVAASVIRAKYRVVQGFVTGQRGIDPGPGCVQTELPVIVRTTLPETTLGAADLAAEVASANEGAVVRLGAAARALVLGEEYSGRKISTVDRATMAQAFAKRYPSLSPKARATLASVLPHAGQASEFGEFDQVAKQETDADVLPVVVISRCGKADDPLLKALQGSSDPKLKLIAKLQTERLEKGASCYATLGPGLEAALEPRRSDASGSSGSTPAGAVRSPGK